MINCAWAGDQCGPRLEAGDRSTAVEKVLVYNVYDSAVTLL